MVLRLWIYKNKTQMKDLTSGFLKSGKDHILFQELFNPSIEIFNGFGFPEAVPFSWIEVILVGDTPLFERDHDLI